MYICAKTTLLTLGAIAVFMTPSVNAAAVKCSEFGGFIPAGVHDYNITVDIDCHVSGGAIVNGNLNEPGKTDYSIYVLSTGLVNGDIQEKGLGLVYVDVGGDQTYIGNIEERDDGNVYVLVDGVFYGEVLEQHAGDVDVQVYGGCPSGGPGLFIGSTVEKGDGDAYLGISEGESPCWQNGEYEGDFTEKGPGICYIKEHTVSELPTVQINCATLVWPD